MDLSSLSLAQIASLLSPKQQEVLLAAISVAANFIAQMQQDEQNDHFMHHHNHQMQQEEQQESKPTKNSSHFLQQMQEVDDEEEEEDDDEDDDEEDDDDERLMDSQIHNLSHNTSNNTNSHHRHININNNNNHHNHRGNSVNNDNNSHSSDADDDDLVTIRLFAEELKQRRKSIRLSQKGAAQSLRAFTGGAQPCTDAIIYHFENLQLEPERAMQLIPLLKDWLDWAEKHRLNGKQLPMMSAVTKVPRERKRKVVLFNEKAKHYLEDAFAKNNHPDRYQLDVISEELNIPTRSIRKWFTNRRQRKRFAEKFNAVGNTSSNSI